MRSNLECWKALQEDDYFERHPLYMGYIDNGDADIVKIERFISLESHQVVVIIGCGYGRESVRICKRTAMVYGIDVSEKILAKAVAYLRDVHGISNFQPVLGDGYAANIPANIDLVYSVVVMQHLTRDIVHDYLRTLSAKLSHDGRMIIQFLESNAGEQDAEIKYYEPSVSWSPDQIVEACSAAGLRILEIKTDPVRPGCVWHWAHIGVI
jgi:cyclopropane fatty-acyl-phospholipid synthase-like methyltransferase